MSSILVLMRHGESIWNRENRFTGSVDVPLTRKGRQDAARAARFCPGVVFDIAYTSPLSRARESAMQLLMALGCGDVPLVPEPLLIEKNYGILQGLNQDLVKAEYGAEKYRLWHRGYETGPPGGESLKAVAERTHPFFRQVVGEDLRLGKNVLLTAHGNVIRSLVMLVEKLDPETAAGIKIGTAEPRLYKVDGSLDKVVCRVADEASA